MNRKWTWIIFVALALVVPMGNSVARADQETVVASGKELTRGHAKLGGHALPGGPMGGGGTKKSAP